MIKTYTTPGGTRSELAVDILKQSHTLIAGATGSGKSVLINSVMQALLLKAPTQAQYVLIDPKKVELYEYSKLPNCIGYADEKSDTINLLNACIDLMMGRYKKMRENREKKSTANHIYIIIDELADLMTTAKAETTPIIQRITQLGRAANIHLIAATQRPTSEIIAPAITVNFDCRIALRCGKAQDSKNIIGVVGAEKLPRYGFCYYSTPETMQPIKVKVLPPDEKEISRLIDYWTNYKD